MNCPELHQNQHRAKGSSKSSLTPQLHRLLLCLLVTGYQNYNSMHSLDLRCISNNLFCQVLSISSKKKKKRKIYCACKLSASSELFLLCLKQRELLDIKAIFDYSTAFEHRIWIALSLPQFLHYVSLDYPVNPCISIISF